MLKRSFLVRLLKKVQMQGGVTHPVWMGTRRDARPIPLVVTLSNHAAPGERGGTHRRWAPIHPTDGYPAGGSFSAAC